MNKKFFLIIGILAILGLMAFWFLSEKSELADESVTQPSDVCLVFQSENPSDPCYLASSGGNEVPVAKEPDQIATNCAQGSVFEKNDCITRLAAEENDKSLCDAVSGTLAKMACLQGPVDVGVSAVIAPKKTAYDSYIRGYASSVSSAAPSSGEAISSSEGVSATFELSPEEQARATPEGFYKRMSQEAPLLLYAALPYQSRPGDLITLQGSGFALDTTNTVYFAGSQVSGLASQDGFTLTFSAPSAAYGTQEVWVTNGRGSSRSSERPIYAFVTQSPVAPPVITSVSPSNPSYTDTVTLSGENLNGLQGVYTTLGPVSGGSLSFKVSDLEYSRLILEQDSLKGSLVPIQVYVQAEGGLSAQPFTFEVQF